MDQVIKPTDSLLGEVALPADKSIAIRSALMAALSDGTSQIVNYPDSADPQSALSCLKQLGVSIEKDENDILVVEGVGLDGLKVPSEPIDCGNSGTTMRLICGILAGQTFDCVLTGDASLNSRPMKRIADPLSEMGASLTLTEGLPPIHIKGNQPMKGISYKLPMASAQVKSCVLLAGLYAEGETTVIESRPSRDHTERMLGLASLEMNGLRHISVSKGHRIPAGTFAVPRDFSAAAFFLAAGAIVPHTEISLRSVGINTSRSALLDVLRAMGANIKVENERFHAGELIADLKVQSSILHGVKVQGDVIPILIDEIPVLAVAAAFAKGRTEIRDAKELRVKETDRIDAMVKNLRLLGADVEEFDDGLAITGGKELTGATVHSYDDHRIAMAMGVAGLRAKGETHIKDADCASISFPGFWEQLRGLVV
ncbi:MAG: 3-phosphoshikimate 1-carboxyvinyltransferase [Bacteroidota bacterium]